MADLVKNDVAKLLLIQSAVLFRSFMLAQQCEYYASEQFNERFRNYNPYFSAINLNTRSINRKQDTFDVFFIHFVCTLIHYCLPKHSFVKMRHHQIFITQLCGHKSQAKARWPNFGLFESFHSIYCCGGTVRS